MFTTAVQLSNQKRFLKKIQQLSISKFPFLHFIEIYFDESQFHLSLFKYYETELPSNIEKSIKKRQAEYLASRYATSMALKNFGFKNFQLKNNLKRVPIWPKEIVGSLSHTYQHTIVVCAKKKSIDLLVGIDIERIINDIDSIQYSSYIIQSKELDNMKNVQLPFNVKLTLVFSLKESLFKAIYSKINIFIDFSAVEVFDLNIEYSNVKLRLVKDLNLDFLNGRIFNGYFDIREKEIITLVVD